MAELDFKDMERKSLELWKKEKIYAFNPKSKKKIYSIDTPPPTVSGAMHVGHSFSYSQQDFIARFKRMNGFEVFYPFGTDDNGLPTERLIEKLKNVRSKSMSRADFIALCLKTLKEITPTFVEDWKNLGISCDYDLSYSTIDEHSRKLSQKSFIELYKKGEAYREKFPTIYCPECQTPVAQAELEDKKKSTFFTTLKFKVNGKDLPIATTRPELLGACVAVFVNPKDKRYKSFIGKRANVPLFNHDVPIIADESANMEKGSGVLMICSYGDKYDVESIKRHKLTPKVIMDKEGRINVKGYENISIKGARKNILESLKKQDLIIEQKTIEHNVNVHDKCGTEIEFLPIEQWFIKILDKKNELIKQGKKIKWHPEHMFKRYENWILGLEWDWPISRNRHFGVPIPVWTCEKCNEVILPKESELPIDPLQIKKNCPKCKTEAKAETDVLDTWATSSLTPQIASSLIDGKIKIPYSLRASAHDIIRTWAFYTIVKSFLHENEIPWKEIAVSGFVTMHGEKMSKSKGNVIAPQTIMNNYGSDTLRYWASTSKLGEDLDYQEKDIITGKKFINKIFNATKFAFMNLGKTKPKKPAKLEKYDELFLKVVNNYIYTCTNRFQIYDYAKAKSNTDELFWKSFCDNYLEVVKGRVYNGSEQQKESAYYTLYQSILTILKLYAPITPFITEHLYQEYFKKHEKDKSIHISEWPKYDKTNELREEDWKEIGSANRFFIMSNLISKIRGKKTENKKSMNSPIILTLDKETYNSLKDFLEDLKNVTTAKEIKEGDFKVEFI